MTRKTAAEIITVESFWNTLIEERTHMQIMEFLRIVWRGSTITKTEVIWRNIAPHSMHEALVTQCLLEGMFRERED